MTGSTRIDIRWPAAALAALVLAAAALAASPPPADAARLSASKARSAVIKYVRGKFGSDYKVHPACYSLGSRKSKCLVHLVHGSKSCTKYATVTLRSGRIRVSMAKPSC